MNPKVSLIIPVYKVEQYLQRCLESVAAQTYDNFETILVDDGSPDNCGKICDEYAATQENVFVIHQGNQGLSGARNSGLKAATGEYVVFLDSDDYVSADFISYLVGVLQAYGADMAATGLAAFYGDAYRGAIDADAKTGCFDREEALSAICYAVPFGVSACAKLYPRELLVRHLFPEGRVHEDLATTYQIIGECSRIAYGQKPVYFYYQRSDSLMHEPLKKSHLSGLTFAREQLKYMEENCPSAVLAAKARIVIKVMEYMPRIIGGSKEEREMFHYLKAETLPYIKSSLHDSKMRKSQKLRCRAILLGYLPTCLVFRLHTWLKQKALR